MTLSLVWNGHIRKEGLSLIRRLTVPGIEAERGPKESITTTQFVFCLRVFYRQLINLFVLT